MKTVVLRMGYYTNIKFNHLELIRTADVSSLARKTTGIVFQKNHSGFASSSHLLVLIVRIVNFSKCVIISLFLQRIYKIKKKLNVQYEN